MKPDVIERLLLDRALGRFDESRKVSRLALCEMLDPPAGRFVAL